MSIADIPSLIIVGVAGAGKSSVARQLTALTGMPSNETDDLIEQLAGCDAATLVVNRGEATLQNCANQAALQTLTMPGIAVIAPTAACHHRVIARIRAAREEGVPVIELFADISTLIRRTGLNAPRAVGLGPTRKMLTGMVTQYRKIYGTYTDESIDTSLAQSRHVAQRIVAYLGQNTVS
ncbi:MAG: shikimate kinase [Actinomycetaceae bacterium]|nr:shikimate kinase [Actinomycetaceae bacterium]